MTEVKGARVRSIYTPRATPEALPGRTTPEVFPPGGAMERAMREAFEAATWLRGSDRALKQLMINYAKLMDGPDGAYYTGKLGPHLLDALKTAAMTPREYLRMFGRDQITSGKLAELRSNRGA
jgi:hypothetical protein